jgi:7-cyano-7-deazaguanine synthase in queuosine biosynthesis
MTKHVIYGHFGSSDKPSITSVNGEQFTFLNLLDHEGKLAYGINKVINDLAKLNLFPSQVGIELLILAAHVQAADTRISRSSESQDSWTREINLVIPVVGDIGRWVSISSVLKRALDFLTGDIWDIQFRKSTYTTALVQQQKSLVEHSFDSLSLFSGGLDSLIGAINLLESEKKTLFVSHAGEGATSKAQHRLFDRLKEEYKSIEFDRIRLWMNFPKDLVEGSQPEMTMRSRSFLFFALGVAAGTCFNRRFTLLVPENGLIALNVPLDAVRVGSHSTHTTHPFYMSRWNELITALEIDAELVNPYWDMTKGEMVEKCLNKIVLSEMVPDSLSCSSPSKGRWAGKPNAHCGYCVPCIIRRAAINAGSIADDTNYTLDDLASRPLNTTIAEGRQIRSFQLSIRRLENEPALAKYLVYNSGPLVDISTEGKNSLAEVYTRGIKEVANLLSSVTTQPLS